MDDKDKNKKQLGYSADIQYEEDYSTDYSSQQMASTSSSSSLNGVEYNDSFMDIIQEDVDALIQMIPGLPWAMQTAINQVFKPVIKDWNRMKDNKYPTRIPDGDKPIIVNPDPITPIPPGPLPGGEFPPYEPTPKPNEDERPGHVVPEIRNEPIPERTGDPSDLETTIPLISDDNLFAPSTSRKVVYEVIDKKEQYELEYTKNFADLVHFYTTRLLGIVSNYYMQIFSGFSVITSTEDAAFYNNQITSATSQSVDEMRHVMDIALRNEVIGANKMNFSINTFTLEGTLYHLKNLRAVQELRLRYAEIDKMENIDTADSMSNKMLNGITDMYSAKYDLAYINLYKHLNGSLRILDDCSMTLMSGLKAKETIIRKGGRK